VDRTLVADQTSAELIVLVNDKRSYIAISHLLWLRLAAVAVEIVHCVGWDSVCCKQFSYFPRKIKTHKL